MLLITFSLGYSPPAGDGFGLQWRTQGEAEQRSQAAQDPVIEVITPEVLRNYSGDGAGDPFPNIWSRTLRIRITGRDGFDKLDVRIPVCRFSSSTLPK